MQYSRGDVEMQPQHNNNGGGLLNACNKGARNEKKRAKSEDFKEILTFLNLPLASSGQTQKFTCDAVMYIYLSQL